MHIDPEGFVIKVEMEKKTKKKLVWEQLKLVESEDTE